jgi:hypothetical protein
MEASSYVLPVFVRLPYGELRQVGYVEAELGCDVETAISQVSAMFLREA